MIIKFLKGLLFATILALCSIPALAQSPVAVTGNLTSVLGANVSSNAFVRIRLRNFSGSVPRVPSVGVISTGSQDVTPNGSGLISTTVWGNDVIQPAQTYYTFEFWSNGRMFVSEDFFIPSSPAFNFNSAAPLSQPPGQSLGNILYANSFTCNIGTPATTWTCVHNFGTQNVVISCYDTTHQMLFPDTVVETDINTVTVTYTSAQAGSCVIIDAMNVALTNQPANAVVTNPAGDQNIIGFNFEHNGSLIPDVGHAWTWGALQNFSGGITTTGITATGITLTGVINATNANDPAGVFTNNHSNTSTGSPEHGLESNCNITVNNARCYGLVMSASDQPGLTGTHPVGGVALVNAPNHNSAYASQGVYGFVAQANFGNGTTDNGTIYTGYGFRVEWQNPAVATGMWNVGFGTSDGVASLGFLLGSQTVYSGPAVGSQYGYFLNYDSGGVQHLSSIGADPFGNLALNAFTGHTSIPNGIDFQEQSSNATSTWGSGWDVCGGNSTQQALVCSYHGDAFAVVPRISGTITPGDFAIWADATHIEDGGAIRINGSRVATTTITNATVTTSATTVMSVSVAIPSTGGPYRILAEPDVIMQSASAINGADCWVSDGTHTWDYWENILSASAAGNGMSYSQSMRSGGTTTAGDWTYTAGSGPYTISVICQVAHTTSTLSVGNAQNGPGVTYLAATAVPQ